MPYLGHPPSTGEENNFKILDDISSYTLTFDGSSSSVVSTSDETIYSYNHRFVQGQRVTYNNGGGGNITGLTSGTVYYIIKQDHNNIQLATSASNATAGTAINITAVGTGASHTLNVAFDGTNTKFKATHTTGQKARITRGAQLVLSVNGVIQQPHDSSTPSTGFGFDVDGTIIFSEAPASTDAFWGHILTNNNVTFDISDNKIDHFTGNGSTSSFTLSKSPPNNENILVTIDGVVQYPNDSAGNIRAYSVAANVINFTSAPGSGTAIEVRHIGFAGATSGGGGGVTGFYGRTGNAVLKSTDHITTGNIVAGVVTATSAVITGDLTVNGTTTTLDTDLIGVDKIEVAANNTTVAVAVTQSGAGDLIRLFDSTTEKLRITDDGKVGIGTDNPSSWVHLQTVSTTGDEDLIRFSRSQYEVGKIRRSAGAMRISGEGNLHLEADYNGNLGATDSNIIFNVDNDEKVRITYQGRIGIGTASPDRIIHAFEPTGNNLLFLESGDTNVDIIQADTGGSTRIRNSQGSLVFYVNGDASSSSAANAVTGLTIDGDKDVHVYDDLFIPDKIIHEGDTNTAIRFPAADTVSVETGGSERVRITSAGLVGIGTADPTRQLEVFGDRSAYLRLGSNRSGAGQDEFIGGIEFFSKDTSGPGAGVRGSIEQRTSESDGSGSNMVFRTGDGSANNTERARITSAGNIKIPDNAKIELGGVQTGSGDLQIWHDGGDNYISGTGNHATIFKTNGAERLRIRSDSNITQTIDTDGDGFIITAGDMKPMLTGNSNRSAESNTIFGISGKWNNTEVGRIAFEAGADTTNKDDGKINFYTRVSGGSLTSRLLIDSTGNLHLRSASTCRLVLGSSGGSVGALTNNENWIRGSGTMVQLNTAGGDYGFEVLGSQKMKLDSSGNLELRSATQNRITFGSAGSSGNDTNWVRGDGNDLMYNCITNHKWEIGGAEALRITSGGDVGVGNDSPNCRLAVRDTAAHTTYADITPSVGDCMMQLWNNPSSEAAGHHATIQFGIHGGSHNRVNTISAVAETNNSRHTATTFCTDDGGSRTEKLRITSAGRVLIGETTSSYPIDLGYTDNTVYNASANVGNAVEIHNKSTTAGASAGIHMYVTGNGGNAAAVHLNAVHTANGSGDFTVATRHSAGAHEERFRITSDGKFYLNNDSKKEIAPVYHDYVSCTGNAWTKFATVVGNQLSSEIYMTAHDTLNSVVITASFLIKVAHYQDIWIESRSMAYSELKIKVISNNNQNFDLYMQRTSGSTASNVEVSIFPKNQEIVTFSSTVNYSDQSLEHTTAAGTLKINGSGGVQSNIEIAGNLNKGSGSFKIPHPLTSKKDTHNLVHSFLEGPQMDLIYRGKIDLVGGTATVNIDTKAGMTEGTFVALNRDVQCFTSNETGWGAVKGSVSGNILTITAQDNSSTDTISWMVVGERQDDTIKKSIITDDDGNLLVEPLIFEETDNSSKAEYYPTS